jgi:hypothetical protein
LLEVAQHSSRIEEAAYENEIDEPIPW